MVMFRVIPSTNLTNLHRTYNPFNFFLFCVVDGIDEMWRSWKFQPFFFFFFFHVLYSDFNFRSVFQHQKCDDMSRHGRQLWEGQNFVINHPTMFKTLFLFKLLFAVKSKSGIKMRVNLLLQDIIDPKNATLFIRDQLQGVITSQPTSPPPHGN